MKIAINTINDYNNYGNRLQNFALQIFLQSLGHDVVTLKNNSNTNENSSKIKKLGILGKKALKNGLFDTLEERRINILRGKNFADFTKENIIETPFSINQLTTDFSFNTSFDCYVIGSDQVWNYSFDRFSKLDFISYSNKPKISYAASFGVNEIPDKLKNMYAEGINKIDYLSVREDSGIDIIKELTGRNANLVLDPTLLLEKKVWEQKIKQLNKFSNNFLVTYFLGELSKEDEDYIKEYARLNSLEIIRLGDISDKEYWISSPLDFVNIISQSRAVFTDSFHACVFSIIFERQFEVFERNSKLPSMNSRIHTLLSNFNLDGQWHKYYEEKKSTINYDAVKSEIDRKRELSISFLKESLEAIGKEN